MMTGGWLEGPAQAQALAMLHDLPALPRWRALHALLAKETP
jgi:hypothetical protein